MTRSEPIGFTDSDSIVEAVLFDLDGVIRHFDPDHPSQVERSNDLAPGSLIATAFETELVERLVTGRLSRAEWIAEVGRRVGHSEAAAEWLSRPGVVDREMVELLTELRDLGYSLAILTNGTDTIPAELDALGVAPLVDAVFNTAEIGVAKPDRRAFLHCCRGLGLEPGAIFFTDDSAANADGATDVGMVAHHFTGTDPLRHALAGALNAPSLLPSR